jgi:hypothetical protein
MTRAQRYSVAVAPVRLDKPRRLWSGDQPCLAPTHVVLRRRLQQGLAEDVVRFEGRLEKRDPIVRQAM